MTPREAVEFRCLQQAVLEMGRRLLTLELKVCGMKNQKRRVVTRVVKVPVMAPRLAAVAPKPDIAKVRRHLLEQKLKKDPFEARA